jgi:hypothetical protein
MSALGQKETCAGQKVMSALPLKADMYAALAYVSFGPKADVDRGCSTEQQTLHTFVML